MIGLQHAISFLYRRAYGNRSASAGKRLGTEGPLDGRFGNSKQIAQQILNVRAGVKQAAR